MLAVQIGHNAGGAAHHVAVAESKVEGADAGAYTGYFGPLFKYGLAGTEYEVAAVLYDQQDKQGGSCQHGVHGDGNPHVLALVAGAGQDALADVAGEHHDEDDDYVRDSLDDTGRARTEVGGEVPDLVVDTHESLNSGHPDSEEDNAGHSDKKRLADIRPVELSTCRGQAEIGGGDNFAGSLAA